jgi:tetratricopeptide (TPR) repeat protein
VVRDASAAGTPARRDSDEPDPAAVARQVDAMGDAIAQGDYDAAQTHLQALQHLLPPRSLTLLRMRAWLAQQRGEDAQALPLYREIVERIPGDRGAAINLALLEATAGQLDEARQRLRRLQASEGGASENERQALARAITEIGASP